MAHYQLLAGTDENMVGLLRRHLQEPAIPAAEKDLANQPGSMRADWADDSGAVI